MACAAGKISACTSGGLNISGLPSIGPAIGVAGRCVSMFARRVSRCGNHRQLPVTNPSGFRLSLILRRSPPGGFRAGVPRH